MILGKHGKTMDGQAPGAPVGEEMEVQRWFELWRRVVQPMENR